MTACVLAAVAAVVSGCAGGALIGGMMQSYRESTTRTIEAEYLGLQGKTFAVVVSAPRLVEADFPGVSYEIARRMSQRLAEFAGASGFIPPDELQSYLYNNPAWPSKPLGELAEELGVERIVYVDLYDYHLNDTGNSYLWNGVAAGTLAVVESDSQFPDDYAFDRSIRVTFPDGDGYGPTDFNRAQVQSVLISRFIDRATWPFYTHEEPWYPDY